MAHPSPSPSGSSSRRRLSEVLGEQQEPFSLDIYLLERGCSPAFLDATACSTCWWPKSRGTGGRTLRRRRPATARNTKGSPRSGVLTMLLSKILSDTTAAVTKPIRQQRAAAAIGWRRRVVAAEKQSMPPDRCCELAVPSASPGAGAGAEDDDGEGDDEDEESKKQLSPVSVLEQSLFEHSPPPPPHAPEALAIFGELLEAAYTPDTLLDDVLAIIARDGSSSTQSKDGGRGPSSTDDSSTPTTPPRARRRRRRRRRKKKHVALLEKDDDIVGRLISGLVVSEMAAAASSVRAEEDLRPAVEDVGAAIAAAMLEALTEETAAELMGMMHGPRLCG